MDQQGHHFSTAVVDARKAGDRDALVGALERMEDHGFTFTDAVNAARPPRKPVVAVEAEPEAWFSTAS